jgi:hypothetical protein
MRRSIVKPVVVYQGSIAMNTTPVDSQRESLALSVACGRSVRLWAKHHDVEFTMAFEWYLQQEFRDLVELNRLRVADRLVGRLLRGAGLAVGQLIKLCTKCPSAAIRLSASRALLTHWITVSDHASMSGRVRAIEERDARDGRIENKSGVWRPHSPFPPALRQRASSDST